MFKHLPKSLMNMRSALRRPRLLLLALPLLLAACATAQKPLPPAPVACPAIPALPPQARQTDLPTLSQEWQRLVDELLQEATEPSSPAGPAKPLTNR